MSDFFKKLGGVVCGLAPVVGAILSIVFPAGGAAITIGTKVVSALPGLIASAESAFGDGTGPIKKQYVLDGAEKIVNAMADISTGGQKETWEAFKPVTGIIIDGIVDATNSLTDTEVFDSYERMKNGL